MQDVATWARSNAHFSWHVYKEESHSYLDKRVEIAAKPSKEHVFERVQIFLRFHKI